jgi:hypothetical protein
MNNYYNEKKIRKRGWFQSLFLIFVPSKFNNL